MEALINRSIYFVEQSFFLGLLVRQPIRVIGTGGAGEQVQAGAGPAVGASRAQPDGATAAVILVLRVLLLLAA